MSTTQEAFPHVIGALACMAAGDSRTAADHLMQLEFPHDLYPACIAWVEAARLVTHLTQDDGYWYIEGHDPRGESVSLDEVLPDGQRWAVRFFTAHLNGDTDATIGMFKATLDALEPDGDIVMARVSDLLAMCASLLRQNAGDAA